MPKQNEYEQDRKIVFQDVAVSDGAGNRVDAHRIYGLTMKESDHDKIKV